MAINSYQEHWTCQAETIATWKCKYARWHVGWWISDFSHHAWNWDYSWLQMHAVIPFILDDSNYRGQFTKCLILDSRGLLPNNWTWRRDDAKLINCFRWTWFRNRKLNVLQGFNLQWWEQKWQLIIQAEETWKIDPSNIAINPMVCVVEKNIEQPKLLQKEDGHGEVLWKCRYLRSSQTSTLHVQNHIFCGVKDIL